MIADCPKPISNLTLPVPSAPPPMSLGAPNASAPGKNARDLLIGRFMCPVRRARLEPDESSRDLTEIACPLVAALIGRLSGGS